MTKKIFCQRLEKELNTLGLPKSVEERKKAVAKLFNVSRHTASLVLNGIIISDKEMLVKVADELDVSTEWLLGQSDSKK